MAINIAGYFVDDTTPMTGNMDGVPHFGIQGPPGPQGDPGGYYVPAIEQTGENELEVSFSPSLPDMPYVAPVKVTVTPDPDSGGNVELDTTLTQSGKAADAKAVGDALNKKLSADELPNAVNDALAQAKNSGLFDGPKGDDYVLSEADKAEIAEMAAELVDVPEESDEFFKIGTPIPANADLNTYKTDGKYYQTGDVATLLNCPTQYNFTLYVLTRTTKNTKTQIIYDYYGKMYIRGNNGSSWRNWETYLTKSDKASIVTDVLSALPTWTGGSY